MDTTKTHPMRNVISRGKTEAGFFELLDCGHRWEYPNGKATRKRYRCTQCARWGADSPVPSKRERSAVKTKDEDILHQAIENAIEASLKKEHPSCMCGCGGFPRGKRAFFIPGHDMRLKGKMSRNEPMTDAQRRFCAIRWDHQSGEEK